MANLSGFICVYDCLDSTNKEVKNLIVKNILHGGSPKSIFAKEQNAGVGKLGKAWFSCIGNVHLSCVINLFDNINNLEDLGLLSLLVAISIKETLLHYDDTLDVKLKWPNDVLVNNEKISGILLETEQNSNLEYYLVIGVGVNLVSYPQNLVATSLLKSGNMNVSALDFSQKLLDIFFNNLHKYNLKSSLPKELENSREKIIKTWLESAFGLNQKVVITKSGEQLVGIFKNLTSSGYLILEEESGKQIIITTRDIFDLK